LTPSDVNDDGVVLGVSAGKPIMYKDGVLMPMQDLGYGGRPTHWSEAKGLVAVGHVFLSTGVSAAAQWDASGALTLLYTRDQANGSVANGQNTHGVTSGFGGRFDAAAGKPLSSAMRWANPQAVAFLNVTDGQWSESTGIDTQGRVYGIDESSQAVVWKPDGSKTVIKGAPGQWTSLVAVTTTGVAVGSSTAKLANGELVSYPIKATLAHGFIVLPVLSTGAQCSPVDINKALEIVGMCFLPDGSNVPVLWSNGRIRRLPIEAPAGSRTLVLTGMNDDGELVGSVRVDSGFQVLTYGLLFTPQSDQVVSR